MAEPRTSVYKIPEKPPHLFDLVGSGTAFDTQESFYDPQKLPILRSYAVLADMSVQDMANLLLKAQDAKKFLDDPITMRIDGETVVLSNDSKTRIGTDTELLNPVTNLPLRGGDLGGPRSGPAFSVPLHPEAVSALLAGRPVEQLDKVAQHTAAVSEQYPNLTDTDKSALTGLLTSPAETNRPVRDWDLQVTNHSLWRKSLQNAITAPLLAKFPDNNEGQGYVGYLNENPALMREVAYAHMHEGGVLRLEMLKTAIAEHKQHPTRDDIYTNLLLEDLRDIAPADRYHPIAGTMNRSMGTGLETHAAETREIEITAEGKWKIITEPRNESSQYLLVKTTDIYNNKDAENFLTDAETLQILGKNCYDTKGIVELKDVITTTWSDLDGIVGQDIVDDKHLKKLQASIDQGNLLGITWERVVELIHTQDKSCFEFRQLMEDLQTEIQKDTSLSLPVKRDAYQNIGTLAAEAKTDTLFSQQALFAEEIGYKLAMCEQQKLEYAQAPEAEKEKKLGKIIGTMSDIGGYLKSLGDRRQAKEPDAQALWEVVENTYRNRLVQWGIDHPLKLAKIGVTDEVSAEAYAASMSKERRTYDTAPDDAYSLRRELGLGKIDAVTAEGRIAAFKQGADALYASIRATQIPYFAAAKALKEAYENKAADPEVYQTAYQNMQVQIAKELAKDPHVMARFNELNGREMAQDLVDVGARKAVASIKQGAKYSENTDANNEIGLASVESVAKILAKGITARADINTAKHEDALAQLVERTKQLGLTFNYGPNKSIGAASTSIAPSSVPFKKVTTTSLTVH
jgi:hypothetical protein